MPLNLLLAESIRKRLKIQLMILLNRLKYKSLAEILFFSGGITKENQYPSNTYCTASAAGALYPHVYCLLELSGFRLAYITLKVQQTLDLLKFVQEIIGLN